MIIDSTMYLVYTLVEMYFHLKKNGTGLDLTIVLFLICPFLKKITTTKKNPAKLFLQNFGYKTECSLKTPENLGIKWKHLPEMGY